MEQEFEPLRFAVDKILPHGLFILAGSGKIGKSWLALDICAAVSSGGKMWDFNTEQGNVLYLALEDNYSRLQGRLKKSKPKMKLIFRGLNLRPLHSESATDYWSRHIILLRNIPTQITNKYKLTLLLIHHTRKMYDPDPLNTLSGSTGLIGSVDGVHVLEKLKRIGGKAKLTIANRDTEGYCFKLEFDPEKCKWLFMGNDVDAPDVDEPLCKLTDEFLKDKWSGTATELCGELKAVDESFNNSPADISKRLRMWSDIFQKGLGINVEFVRSHKDKIIHLTRMGEQKETK